jgi:uncharacterized protein YndB with AHSA1/START domain/DNA-binding transcriptional ArsR family regulator
LAAMDDVFKALADPSRRQLLDSLNQRSGQNLRELCAGLDMARQSVTKHLAILEAADLVVVVRRGRERLHYLNAAPINDIADRWIHRYHQERVEALSDLKSALESRPMAEPAFVYKTYIKTKPQQLWEALTDPAFTERYWGSSLQSDWQPGSTITWNQRGVVIEDAEQVVLESDPYVRLSYTWHTFVPELKGLHGIPDDVFDRAVKEPRSKVTFEIEDLGEMVKLTVVHDGFEEGSAVVTLISEGWPRVLSGLKSLLETGDVLPSNA